MDIFALFSILIHFSNGIAMFLTGLFLWKKFKEDFEIQTLGGILAFMSLLFFWMGLRNSLWNLGWIGERFTFYMFFVQYALILFFILPFALPRFLYLVFNQPIVKKIGLILGSGLYLIYLAFHFSQREKIVIHYTPQGLAFEPSAGEKFFLAGIFALFIPLIFYRINIHFSQWRKTKAFPHKFLIYLAFLFMNSVTSLTVLPRFGAWEAILGFVLSLAGILAIYLISSQALIKKEELEPFPIGEEEKEIKKVPEGVDKDKEIRSLITGMETKIEELKGDIKKLKKETGKR